jgi:hypothetical protein
MDLLVGDGYSGRGVHVKGHIVLDYNGIRYSEISANSLRQGFTVALADSSHKVKWFLV